MKLDRFRLLFFGSDSFSIRVLEHLLKKEICHTEVITNPHTLLNEFSARQRLLRYAWPNGLQNIPLDSHNIGLVASFGSLIDEATVNRFPYGLFNVHPSLLPKYRGSTPIQTAVFDGLKETGCTIMRILPVPKFDIGDIILQKKISIKHGEYAIDLRDRMADLGAEMVEQFLLDYDSLVKAAVPQDGSRKSLARKFKPEQGHLRFKTETMDLIWRKVRAYTGFIDIYITCLGGVRVRLDGMEIPCATASRDLDDLISGLSAANCDRVSSVIDQGNHEMHMTAGAMFFHKIRHRLYLKTADGRWLAFESATPENKPRMSALDFYNGYLSKIPQVLHITED